MTTQETSPAKRQRIAKLMARAGLCSRRDAEAWIVEGRVSVNGNVLTSPALDVASDDAILVDGAPLPQLEKTRLFLFHKPRGLVTSDRDLEGRETVADYLRAHWPEGPRVVTIGRLDINTEGLLLLTNDGGLARTLELPQTGWVRRYRVRAKGSANPADLDALAAGVTIDGVAYAGIEAKLDRTQGANCWMTMSLREGKNREIKRVLEHLGLEVNRLIRLSFGPFQLLDLPEGAVEEVRTRVLRDQLGEKLAGQAGVELGEAAPIAAPTTRDTPLPGRDARKGAKTRGKPDLRGPRVTPGREGGRERRDDRDAPAPIRGRPAAGTRKHVSTLRFTESEAARKGPRKRIERTDTRDRRDRRVTVERLVSARPKPEHSERQRSEIKSRARPPREGAAPRSRDAGGNAPRSRPSKGDVRSERSNPRPSRNGEGRGQERRDGPGSTRRHASLSAIGKRERMTRSGAPHDPSGKRDRDRRPEADRPKRARPTGDRYDGRHDNAPRPGGGGKPRGRPMGAASRKPNSRKPSADMAPRAARPRNPTRSGPAGRKPRGPTAPRR